MTTDERHHDFTGIPVERYFECFFNFLGWWQWSLGVHIDRSREDVLKTFGAST